MTRTVMITGASSGYGRTTAQLFLDRGWRVVATMRRPDDTLFAAAADRLRIVGLDVTDRASIDAAVAAATEAFGAIDVLVNNAGIGLLSAFEATPEETTREIFETNTFGVMAMCRAVIPGMRERGSGVIVNVTSSAAIAPMPLVAVYTASKSAIEGFTESLAFELAILGIRARLVEPGLGPTTRFGANGAARMAGLTPPPYDAFAAAYLARMADYPTAYATEAEVAEAVFVAATEEGPQLRYPAGPDSRLFAELRWAGTEARYHARIGEMFAPEVAALESRPKS
ncbi:MAG: SDR family oxidoreductase [Bauldia sp.]|nr:SDR family oxidoreductase [Bauldia sp.]